jgi:uncharacterized membrane protein YozB (DUF420 family)
MIISYSDLPVVNASLNASSAILLTVGLCYIKRGNPIAHRNCMIGALITSTLFLACYLTYHFQMQRLQGRAHTSFVNPGWFRPIYLAILFTHLAGAITIVPLVVITVNRAVRQRFDLHKKIARWTWPIWMYVSVTGVLIYFLLYRIFPQR